MVDEIAAARFGKKAEAQAMEGDDISPPTVAEVLNAGLQAVEKNDKLEHVIVLINDPDSNGIVVLNNLPSTVYYHGILSMALKAG